MKCQYRGPKRQALIKHYEKVHKFKCKVCNETIKGELVLNIHSRTNHAHIPKNKKDLDKP